MFAVIKTGGKQYIVKEGDTLDIEKIEGEDGSKLTLDSVLLVSDGEDVKIGTPIVDGARIEAEIVKQFKDKKVVIQKFKRKTGFRRRTGHRQMKTKVKIIKITSTK